MADLTSVLNAIGAASADNQLFKGVADSAFAAKKDAMGELGAAEQEKLANKAIIENQANIAALRSQQNTRRAATAFGTNMDSSSQIITELATVARDSSLKAVRAQQEVAEIEANNSLFSNPLGFFRDLLYGDEARAKADAATALADSATSRLDALNISTQQNARTQAVIAETHTESTVYAAQKQMEAEAAEAAARTKANLSGVDIERIQVLDQLNSRGTSLAMQAFSAQSQAESAARESARLKMAQDAANEGKEGLESLRNYYNIGAAELGRPPATTDKEFKEIRMINKGLVEQLASMGYEKSVSGKASLGSNPIEALAVAREFRAPVTAEQRQMLDIIGNTANSGTTLQAITDSYIAAGLPQREAMQQAAADFKDKTKKPQLQLDAINRAKAGWLTQIKPTDQANPYQLTPLGNLKDIGVMNDNPFLASTVKPVLDAATAPTDFDLTKLISWGVAAIESNKATSGDVIDGITSLAQQAVMRNNAGKNYIKFGMDPQMHAPLQFTVDSGGLFGGSVTSFVDATDPTRVSQALVEAMKTRRNTTQLLTDVATQFSPFGFTTGR